jgi:hypothetical protein
VEILELVLHAALTMGLTYAFVHIDRTRLSSIQRQRGWNTATTGAAIFTFSPLCIIAHFWVTRRSLSGLAQGFVALTTILIAHLALSALYDTVGLGWFLFFLAAQPLGLGLLAAMLIALA